VVKKVFQIVLWAGAGAYVVAGVLTLVGAAGGYREADSLGRVYVVFGCLLLLVAALAAFATFLAGRSAMWFVVAPLILGGGLFIGLLAMFWIDMEKGDVHRRQFDEEYRSGRYSFDDEPALFAVAEAITANDQDAIRASAKNVRDLQAPGRDGTTLLCWAVRETWQRPQLVEAVRTLLSLGADPNYTNGHRESFALANAVHGPAAGLRAMLDAGGDPNARNESGWPIVFMHFKLGYYKNEERARLDMLLDRGADINAVVPATESECAGCTLLLYTTQSGLHDGNEYANALHLLDRGADPHRVAANGMTLSKMLKEHRKQLGKSAPQAFTQLWDWAQAHGIVIESE
jgi:uncharacterized protein